MKKIITFFLVMFLFTINVNAASLCSYEEQNELNSKAANIRVSYESVTEEIQFEDMPSTKDVFYITILNVTEEFYILLKNDINNEEVILTVDDISDGAITYKWDYAETVTNFTIQVYTTNKTNCAEERYKTIYLTTPRYNEFYNYEICQELPDFYLCQKYVTFAPISRSEFATKINNYQNGNIDDDGEIKEEEKDETIIDKAFNFVDEYKWYILGAISIITIIGITIYRIKTKKQRELGL